MYLDIAVATWAIKTIEAKHAKILQESDGIV
jgi:hypothetical protein